MTPPRSSDVSQKTFRTAMGGFNRSEVSAYLESVAADIAALTDERDRLATRLAQMGEQEFDFDALSHEIGQILTAAKDAADGLRNRAEEEVSRWRSEAQTETSEQRTQAALDSEAMRADAWSVGTQLLAQAEALAESLTVEARTHKTEVLAETEREALALTGQSERDAHRLQASARREADEMLRLAKMESERLLVEARAEHEHILESANAAAEAAQERARALEVRRNEMLTELESVRATVAKVESDLEEKRLSLEAAAPDPEPEPESEPEEVSGVKIVPAKPEIEQTWSDSVVKLIPAAKPELATDEVDADAIADEVRRMKTATDAADEAKAAAMDLAFKATQEEEARVAVERAEEEHRTDAETMSDSADEPSDEEIVADEVTELDPGQADDREEVVAPSASAPPSDEGLDGLFASLRTDESSVLVASEAAQLSAEVASNVGADSLSEIDRVSVPVRLDIDPYELADHLLLPITNRILRSVKRQLTDAQNIALEGIRVDESDWEPGTGDLANDLHGDFVILAQESFAAGYSATETMTNKTLGRAKPEDGDIIDHSDAFASGLSDALSEAFLPSETVRANSSATSRVFRVWRTDEAERRVRHRARDAYHRGISRALAVAGIDSMFISVGGRGCSDCRAAAERGSEPTGGDFDGTMPPLHDGCGCTVVPGS